MNSALAALMLALTAGAWNHAAWTQEEVSRTIPSRVLPVPDTVSPALQKLTGQAPRQWPTCTEDGGRMDAAVRCAIAES